MSNSSSGMGLPFALYGCSVSILRLVVYCSSLIFEIPCAILRDRIHLFCSSFMYCLVWIFFFFYGDEHDSYWGLVHNYIGRLLLNRESHSWLFCSVLWIFMLHSILPWWHLSTMTYKIYVDIRELWIYYYISLAARLYLSKKQLANQQGYLDFVITQPLSKSKVEVQGLYSRSCKPQNWSNCFWWD